MNTPKERGLELRRAVNFSIRNNIVYYEQVGKNRWMAEVEYRRKESVMYKDGESEWTGVNFVSTAFEVYFTPDQLDYNGCHVYNLDQRWLVDWKTYQWAVRKLSQHQVIQKMVDS